MSLTTCGCLPTPFDHGVSHTQTHYRHLWENSIWVLSVRFSYGCMYIKTNWNPGRFLFRKSSTLALFNYRFSINHARLELLKMTSFQEHFDFKPGIDLWIVGKTNQLENWARDNWNPKLALSKRTRPACVLIMQMRVSCVRPVMWRFICYDMKPTLQNTI